MSASEKLAGYAKGFSELDDATIAANVTADYKLLDKGKVIAKKGLPTYWAELKKLGKNMDITNVAVDGGTARCKWQVGGTVDSGMITFSDLGVSQEQLYYP